MQNVQVEDRRFTTLGVLVMSPPKNVLIIEDDDNLRAALSRCASKHAFHVYETSDPTTAIELILTHSPQLLIADWDLRHALDGVDVVRCASIHSPHTRVVMISGKSMSELRLVTRDLKVHIFLSKPFGLQDMTDILKTPDDSE